MEIEPRFSIDKLTGTSPAFGPFKEWYFANNYIYDMGRNDSQEQSTRYMGLGTDIETGLPMSLSLNVYAKYQWQNYGASNENEWDGYRFKVKYFVPITQLWGGNLSYIGFTNFDWGSDTGDDNFYDNNGKHARTSNSIASSHILGAELRSLALLCCCALLAQRWPVERRRQPELRQRRLQRSLYRLGWLPVVGYNF